MNRILKYLVKKLATILGVADEIKHETIIDVGQTLHAYSFFFRNTLNTNAVSDTLIEFSKPLQSGRITLTSKELIEIKNSIIEKNANEELGY